MLLCNYLNIVWAYQLFVVPTWNILCCFPCRFAFLFCRPTYVYAAYAQNLSWLRHFNCKLASLSLSLSPFFSRSLYFYFSLCRCLCLLPLARPHSKCTFRFCGNLNDLCWLRIIACCSSSPFPFPFFSVRFCVSSPASQASSLSPSPSLPLSTAQVAPPR